MLSQNEGDVLEHLPTDNQELPPHDSQLINKVFVKQKTVMDKILCNSKNILFMGALFILLSLPPVDALLQRYIPVLHHPYILIGFKAVLMMVIYFVVVNMYLVRK